MANPEFRFVKQAQLSQAVLFVFYRYTTSHERRKH
jgi:hypothetical protein